MVNLIGHEAANGGHRQGTPTARCAFLYSEQPRSISPAPTTLAAWSSFAAGHGCTKARVSFRPPDSVSLGLTPRYQCGPTVRIHMRPHFQTLEFSVGLSVGKRRLRSLAGGSIDFFWGVG